MYLIFLLLKTQSRKQFDLIPYRVANHSATTLNSLVFKINILFFDMFHLLFDTDVKSQLANFSKTLSDLLQEINKLPNDV